MVFHESLITKQIFLLVTISQTVKDQQRTASYHIRAPRCSSPPASELTVTYVRCSVEEDRAADVMVQVQLFWASLSEDGNSVSWQVCGVKIVFFQLAWEKNQTLLNVFSEMIGLRWKSWVFKLDCMLSLSLPSEVTNSLESWIPPWLNLHLSRHVFCKMFLLWQSSIFWCDFIECKCSDQLQMHTLDMHR